jgi:hypothetical protein
VEWVLREQLGLLRLAIPTAMAMLGLILDDTYAKPGRRSALNFTRGPLLGLTLALASQGVFWISNPDLAIPRWITFYGCVMSLLLSSAARMLFPPVTDQLLGANAPGFWLKQAEESRGNPQGISRVLKGISAIVALVILGTWIAERSAPPQAIVVLLVGLLVAYQISKRG